MGQNLALPAKEQLVKLRDNLVSMEDKVEPSKILKGGILNWSFLGHSYCIDFPERGIAMDTKTILKLKVLEIVDALHTHSLVIFLTTKSNMTTVTGGIWRLENRLLVRNFLTRPNSKSIKDQRDRMLMYKFPDFHVLVMYPVLFRKDAKYIKALAKVNKILVIQDNKESYTLYTP